MPAFTAAGAGFLCAVLWFDLMFDVQARGRAEPSTAVLASIAAYYRRVTIDAVPMGRLISAVMLLTLVSIAVELVRGGDWLDWVSLVATLAATGLAVTRTVPAARRLGRAEDAVAARVRLARSLLRDHLVFLALMALVLTLQLARAAAVL